MDRGAKCRLTIWPMTQTLEISSLLADGLAALEVGAPDKAASICQRLLQKAPDLTEGHFLVGLVALAKDDPRTAMRAFGSVTKLDPQHAAGWAQLARLMMKLGQPLRAEKALARAAELKPADPVVQDLIGVTYSLLGDQIEACRWYQAAYGQDPHHPGYGVNLASSLVFLGETDRAQEIIASVLEVHPSHPQAHWLAASVTKETDPAVPAQRLAAAQRLASTQSAANPADAAFLGYAAGKGFEDLEAWDDAFEGFAVGAAAKRKTIQYDDQKEQAFFDALASVYTPQWLSSLRDGHKDPSAIFVVGQPRTGTTLIERIMTSHSAVESAGELQQFGLSMVRLAEKPIADRFSAAAVEAVQGIDPAALGQEYMRTTAGFRKGAARFVDKLPGNYIHVPWILAALPAAKIIHVVRDPADSCFASFKQLFADAYPHSYDLREMARHHARYLSLMAIWRERFPGRFLDVAYEEIVRDTETQARRLIDYLGLAWEPACLAFYRSEGAVATASAVQVREKAHTRSVGRWRRYESHVADMLQTLKNAGISFE